MKTNLIVALVLLSGVLTKAHSQASDLPIKIMNGMPYMEATINDKGPYLFGFDSGFGGELELDSSLAAQLGFKPSGQMEMGDPSGRNNVVLSTTKVGQLQLGKESFKNISAILRNRRAMPGMEKVAGILGISLFKNNLITLDYINLKFTLTNGRLAAADNKTIFDYVTRGGGVPGISIKVGDHNITAYLDTRGMSSGFVLPESLIKKLSLAGEPKVVGRARTVSSEITINEVKLNDKIMFGSYEYLMPDVSYPALSQDAVIGSKILQKFSITIDQKNKRLQLIRNSSAQSVSNTQLVSKDDRSSNDVKDYIGQYELRTVSLDEKGNLCIQRTDGPKLVMVKKGVDEYSLEIVPTAIIKFERDKNGKVTSLKILNRDGNWETSKKLN